MELLAAWKRGQKDKRVQAALADIPGLIAAIRGASFAHGKGWLTIPGLLGRNKAGEWKILKLLAGGYAGNGDGRPAQRPAPPEKEPSAEDIARVQRLQDKQAAARRAKKRTGG